MSTMGREVDEIAKQRREHAKRTAKQAETLRRAIGFAVHTLNDSSIADEVARKTSLAALEPWAL